jgi:hypothetical protein
MFRNSFLLGALAVWALAADLPGQRFGMRIPDLSEHVFAGGGIVVLPLGKPVKTFEFVLGPPGAKYLGPGRVAVAVNGKRLENVEVASEGANLVVTAVSPEDGFVPADGRVKVDVYEMRKGDYRQSWLLRYGKSTFLRESVGEIDGTPMEFSLEEPERAVVLFADDPSVTVDVKGSVNVGAGLASITLNGAAVPFQSKQGESVFAKPLVVDRQTKQIELSAKDKDGNSCTLLIPVVAKAPAKR